MSTRRSNLRKWIETACLAVGAGLGALLLQPHDAPLRTLVICFFAAALPVVGVHVRNVPSTPSVGLVEKRPGKVINPDQLKRRR